MTRNIKTPQYYDTQHNDIQHNVSNAEICNQAHHAECLMLNAIVLNVVPPFYMLYRVHFASKSFVPEVKKI